MAGSPPPCHYPTSSRGSQRRTVLPACTRRPSSPTSTARTRTIAAWIAGISQCRRRSDRQRICHSSSTGSGSSAAAPAGAPRPVRLHTQHDALRGALKQVARFGPTCSESPALASTNSPSVFQLCDELGHHGVARPHVCKRRPTMRRRHLSRFGDARDRRVPPRLPIAPCVVVVSGGSEVEQQGAMMGVEFSSAQNRVGRECCPRSPSRCFQEPCTSHAAHRAVTSRSRSTAASVTTSAWAPIAGR